MLTVAPKVNFVAHVRPFQYLADSTLLVAPETAGKSHTAVGLTASTAAWYTFTPSPAGGVADRHVLPFHVLRYRDPKSELEPTSQASRALTGLMPSSRAVVTRVIRHPGALAGAPAGVAPAGVLARDAVAAPVASTAAAARVITTRRTSLPRTHATPPTSPRPTRQRTVQLSTASSLLQ
jgi:hypothetical protein